MGVGKKTLNFNEILIFKTRVRGIVMKAYAVWLFFISLVICVLTLVSVAKDAHSQVKRDEETAKEVDKINPIKPVGEAIDKTVNKVSPIKVPTESKLVQDERACYQSCAQEKDALLKRSRSEVDRGQAWASYHKCKSSCPEKAASQNRDMERGTFQDRYPAGSTIDR